MSDITVSDAKQKQLAARMAELGIDEKDMDEKFILGSGSGGQKVNKTASCVQLKHLPSGIVVKCQKSRSRVMNRFQARRELADRIEEKIKGAESARQQAREKIRRQKRRRSRRQKEKMLEDKKRQSRKKERRRTVDTAEN